MSHQYQTETMLSSMLFFTIIVDLKIIFYKYINKNYLSLTNKTYISNFVYL